MVQTDHEIQSDSHSRTQASGEVLVVDDDQDTLQAVSEVLTAEGYSVTCARDGLQALALVNQRTPALLILDLMMPRMNGWEFLAHVHHQPQCPPVLVLSADRNSAIGHQAGVSAYLPKPVELDELLAAVASLTQSAPNRSRLP